MKSPLPGQLSLPQTATTPVAGRTCSRRIPGGISCFDRLEAEALFSAPWPPRVGLLPGTTTTRVLAQGRGAEQRRRPVGGAPLHLAVQGQDGGGQVRRRCNEVPELQASVVHDLVLLSCVGLWLVLMHGGGPEIISVLPRPGHPLMRRPVAGARARRRPGDQLSAGARRRQATVPNALHLPLALLLSPGAKLADRLALVHSTSTGDKHRSPDKECVALREFLQNKGTKFSTVDTRGDSLRLAAHGISIPADNWIDIQDLINFNGRGNRTSMGDLAAVIIDPSYSTMKEDFPSESHHDWELQPLPGVNLNYTATDGYVSYELYKRLKKIMDGQRDLPPREVVCPDCKEASWKASLPPGWVDDNTFVGTDYWEWVAHCHAHNIKFDPKELPPGGSHRQRLYLFGKLKQGFRRHMMHTTQGSQVQATAASA